MTKAAVEVYRPGDLRGVDRQASQMERFRAYSHALEAVDDPRCKRPIPRFMLDMPWADDDEAVADRIIAAILASDDPYQQSDDPATLKGKDLIGKRVTVHGMSCRPSDKEGGWGAYLLLDVTVENSDVHQVVSCGAKQAVAVLAYAWARGDIPCSGTFTKVTETSRGNVVLGFIVEPEL